MSDESPASETDRTEAPGDKSGPPGEGFGSRFNKKLLTLGATVTALVGIVGGIAALRDELARESLHITSYTVGSAEVLGDLERDGVVFHPFEYR